MALCLDGTPTVAVINKVVEARRRTAQAAVIVRIMLHTGHRLANGRIYVPQRHVPDVFELLPKST